MAEQVTKTEKARLSQKEQYDALRDGKMVGFHCPACNKDSITPRARCECGGPLETKEFGTTGTIDTYTIQRIASEQFLNDVPFAWVIVRLDDGGPRVTGWIPYISRKDEISIGDKVRLTTSYKPGFMFEKF